MCTSNHKLWIYTCYQKTISEHKAKENKRVLRANGFQKAVGRSGIFFLNIFGQKYPKIVIFSCSLRSKFFNQIFVQKMADFAIFACKKIEQMGKKRSVVFSFFLINVEFYSYLIIAKMHTKRGRLCFFNPSSHNPVVLSTLRQAGERHSVRMAKSIDRMALVPEMNRSNMRIDSDLPFMSQVRLNFGRTMSNNLTMVSFQSATAL